MQKSLQSLSVRATLRQPKCEGDFASPRMACESDSGANVMGIHAKRDSCARFCADPTTLLCAALVCITTESQIAIEERVSALQSLYS